MENVVTIPEDILFEIIINANIITLAKFRQTGSLIENILNKHVTLNLLAEIHGLPYSESFHEFLEYSLMLPGDLLILSADNGDIRVVDALISTTVVPVNAYIQAMAGAAGGGYHVIVDKMHSLIPIESRDRGVYNWVMVNAAEGGHLDIVNQMIKLGADNYNTALTRAAGNGHQDIVSRMVTLGAKDYDLARDLANHRGYTSIADQMQRLIDA